MKKIVYGLLILAVLIGGGLALFEDKIFTDVPEDVITSLENRYGEKFKFVEYIDEEQDIDSRVMNVKSDRGIFKVTRYYDGSGKVQYNDNYLGYKYKKRIEEKIDDLLKMYLIDNSIKYEVDLDGSTFPNNTNKNMSLEDLLADSNTYIKLNIISNFKLTDTFVSSFANKVEMKVVVHALESEGGRLIDMDDFDSVSLSSKSDGKRVYFSVDEEGDLVYLNRE